MFFPRPTAPRFREASLSTLRLSLNAPVITTDSLPHGPARAAIALSRTSQGRYKLAIAVRSLRSRQLAVYAPEEAFEDETAAAVGLDAALSFAESMGFLFDDDELAAPAPDARARAFARWRELVTDGDDETDDPLGRSETGARPPLAVPEPLAAAREPEPERVERAGDRLAPLPSLAGAATPGDELVLEDAVVEDAASGISARAADPSGADPETTGRRRAEKQSLPLTKFRGMADAAPGAAESASASDAGTERGSAAGEATSPPRAPAKAVLITPHGPALGRLQLVKRRRGEGSDSGPSWLQRLLGSF
jgi:hypothetical protein